MLVDKVETKMDGDFNINISMSEDVDEDEY